MEQPFQKSGEREQTSPHAHPFDKLQAVRKLTGEKFPEKQAMAIVETIEDACDGLATQVGMERMELALRSDMERMELALRGDMERMEASLRGDMERMEASLRGDMERVETSLRGDMCNEIEKVELRLRADMGGMRADIQAEFKRFYWYIPVVMGTVVGILKFT